MLIQIVSGAIFAYAWHGSGYLQGTCIPLARIRVPAGYLHTPGTDQGTCRAPAYAWH